MKFKRTISILIFALLFVGLMAAFVFGSSFFLKKRGESLRQSMQIIADEKALKEEREEISKVLENSVDDRDELSNYILDGDEGTAAFLGEIDKIAKKLKVEITTSQLRVIDPAAEEKSKDKKTKLKEERFKKLTVTYALEGSEAAVKKFILLLETIPFASQLTQLQLAENVDVQTGYISTSGLVTIEVSITNI